MALRTVARRWPAASQVRALLQQGSQQQGGAAATRYSTQTEYTGDAIKDKEKAAENRYIHKLEEERKAAAAAVKQGAASVTQGVVESPATPLKPDAAGSGFLNTAVVAGLIAAVAGYWLISGSGSSKKQEKESA